MDYTYKNISESILVKFEEIPQAKNMVTNYRQANTDNLKAIYGEKLFSNYATPQIWVMWYAPQANIQIGRPRKYNSPEEIEKALKAKWRRANDQRRKKVKPVPQEGNTMKNTNGFTKTGKENVRKQLAELDGLELWQIADSHIASVFEKATENGNHLLNDAFSVEISNHPIQYIDLTDDDFEWE